MGLAHQNYLKRQIALREESLASTEADLKTAPTTEQRRSLDSRARQLTTEIDDLDAELQRDDMQSDFAGQTSIEVANSSTANIRNVERRWTEYLHHVNHRTAKAITDDILIRFKSEPGDSLLVFQEANDFLGERYLEYLKSQIKDSKIGCCSPPCQVGFLNSHPSEIEFLSEFARRFNVEKLPSQELSIDLILDGVQGVLESCTIFFLEVNLSDFNENREFMDWFVHQFWKTLLDRVDRVRQKNPLFVCLGAVTLDSELEEEFVNKIRFALSDCPDRLVVFEGEVWKDEEIRTWMTRYSGIPLPHEEREKVTQNVLKYQKGIPSRAEEKLRKELERLAG
jgi:inactive STAND